MQISVTVDDKATPALKALYAGTKSNLPLMQKISVEMLMSTKRNFQAQGRPKWEGLAASTIKSRERRHKWPGKILQVTGALAASVHSTSREGEAIVGTNIRYGRIQQMGGTINMAARSALYKQNRYSKGKKKGAFKKGTTPGQGFTFGAHSITIPARPYLGLQPAEVQLIKKMTSKFYTTATI